MREPHVACDTCERVRLCSEHTRSEFPPDAAKAWMARTCPVNGRGCAVRYRAGLEVRGPFVGQYPEVTP